MNYSCFFEYYPAVDTWVRTKSWTPEGVQFTIQEKEDGRKVYEEVKSVKAVIQRLGYPTRQTFYQWLREKNNPMKKVKPPRRKIHNSPAPPLAPVARIEIENASSLL